MRFFLVLALAFLVGCAPTFRASISRADSEVQVIVTTGVPMELVGVTLTGDSFGQLDPRCSLLEAGLVSCDLGSLAAGETLLVLEGAGVACVATGYESGSPLSYRVARCEVRP